MAIMPLLVAVAVLFLLGYAAIALLLARKKSWIMMTARVGVTVLSAIVAIPICLGIAELLSDIVYELLISNVGEEITLILKDLPVGCEGVRVLASLLIAPILYPFMFLFLRLICLIVIWILEKCMADDLQAHTNLAITLPLGALDGFLAAFFVLIPLCGFCAMGANMIDTMVETKTCDTAFVQETILEPLDLSEDDLEYLADQLENNAVVTVVHKTLGKPVFNALTTAKLDASATHGQTIKMNLERELCGVVQTASYAMEVVDSLTKEEYTKEDKDLLYATADSFFASEWIRTLSADALATMSGNWLEGKDFAGYARPKVDDALNPTLNCVLSILSQETNETLENDIHVILDIVGDFLVYDLLTDDADYAELVKTIGTNGLLTDMMAKLQKNERLAPLATELKSLSIRLVTSMLGVEQLKDGQYAEMMGNVAGTLTDALDMSKEERDEYVVEAVQNAFADEGYDVPPEVVVEVTDKIVADLGADGEITGDELTDYLVNHSDELAESLPDGLPEDLPDEIPDGILDNLPQN